MWPKVYTDEKCPDCGREDCSERVSRPKWVRIFLPNTKMMKCRLCLKRFLVRHFNH